MIGGLLVEGARSFFLIWKFKLKAWSVCSDAGFVLVLLEWLVLSRIV